jgi:hypothetical protein
MARYHFHVRTLGELVQDEEGVEFADLDAAIVEAVRGARCLMKGEIETGSLRFDQSIEIWDSSGQQVTVVPFSEALNIIGCAERAQDFGSYKVVS